MGVVGIPLKNRGRGKRGQEARRADQAVGVEDVGRAVGIRGVVDRLADLVGARTDRSAIR